MQFIFITELFILNLNTMTQAQNHPIDQFFNIDTL